MILRLIRVVVLIVVAVSSVVVCTTSFRNGKALRSSHLRTSNQDPYKRSVHKVSLQNINSTGNIQKIIGLKSLPEDCGRHSKSSQRIAGGRSASDGEFPSNVFILFDNILGQFCGGTVISDRYILTAAHCTDIVHSPYYKDVPTIYTGYRRHGSTVKVHKAELVCTSNKYSKEAERVFYDVAIIKLTKPIQFDKHVQPACLPKQDFTMDMDRRFVAVGFGMTDDYNPASLPEVLQVLPFKPVDCDEEDVHKTRVCFTSRDPQLIGDSCMGDSGGPVLTWEENKHTIVAATSYGPEECQPGLQGYAVNANIYSLLDEIDKLLKACA